MEPELLPIVLDELLLDKSPTPEQQGLPLDGSVQFSLKSGCIYEGQLSAGRLHGQGKLTFPDGMHYEGDFFNNAITGKGKYCWPSGVVYEGEVLNGVRHGHGRQTFGDIGAVYEGDWQHGVRHGQGTITLNAAGSHFYRGEWRDDMKWGVGMMQYDNGDVYEGDWECDVRCGHGTMKWQALRQQYEGYWARGLPHGVGTHIWLQQLVTEPTPTNHAMLLMFNRYWGHFKDGKRHGYGVLYYATGARYEGWWVGDKKEGEGCFVFENGEVWRGVFSADRPVVGEGDSFAPRQAGMAIAVEDLVSEEEVPAAAARGVANVLAVYNSDLRALYDKYCRRPSLHLRHDVPRPSFTMVTCQVWELASDARLVTAGTPLARLDGWLERARRPPEALAAFRAQAAAAMEVVRAAGATHADLGDGGELAQGLGGSEVFWEELAHAHVRGGLHAPLQELLFREFCEACVRIAAARYRHIPGLERRLHTLINAHLLHQVAKAKASLPAPPRTPLHSELWSGSAFTTLQSREEVLQAAWGRLVGALDPPSHAHAEPATDTVAAAAGGENGSGGEDVQPLLSAPLGEGVVYGRVSSVREGLRLLRDLGLLPSAADAQQAAAAMVFHYLTINTFAADSAAPQKLRIEKAGAADGGADGGEGLGEGGGGRGEGSGDGGEDGVQELGEADVREVLCWLDQPLLYADWVEGVCRVADVLRGGVEGGLTERLSAFLDDMANCLRYGPPPADEPAAAAEAEDTVEDSDAQ